ncbi:PilZ domain-containing protein [Marinobacter mobilis]|uniref:PilZ domain-containing protein n=1 Tax=Marinobacter mobilis TaxID=488533 RepID=A0A1H2SAE3_9GAMM|nr:PilZ domain-containing protein [Marinobacter mobilis]SDW28104.1 PilZ domain-containing protein [Marinobacter mobilis]
MRRFIRHPTEFPILVFSIDSANGDEASLCDISQGGLACSLQNELCPGTCVTLGIPSLQQEYRVSGLVVRCSRASNGYRVGIQFTDEAETFKSKMVEQVCQIEHYRRELRSRGRELDSETAAREWIERFGSQFADIFSGPH